MDSNSRRPWMSLNSNIKIFAITLFSALGLFTDCFERIEYRQLFASSIASFVETVEYLDTIILFNSVGLAAAIFILHLTLGLVAYLYYKTQFEKALEAISIRIYDAVETTILALLALLHSPKPLRYLFVTAVFAFWVSRQLLEPTRVDYPFVVIISLVAAYCFLYIGKVLVDRHPKFFRKLIRILKTTCWILKEAVRWVLGVGEGWLDSYLRNRALEAERVAIEKKLDERFAWKPGMPGGKLDIQTNDDLDLSITPHVHVQPRKPVEPYPHVEPHVAASPPRPKRYRNPHLEFGRLPKLPMPPRQTIQPPKKKRVETNAEATFRLKPKLGFKPHPRQDYGLSAVRAEGIASEMCDPMLRNC